MDAGLEPGQRIVSDYDPMIAKLIVTARDRQEAVALMRTALAGSAVPGIVTNIGFLQTLLEMPEVVAGDLHTGLIDAMTEDDLAEAVDPAALQLAAAHVAAAEADRATDSHIAGEPVGMWADGSGWRGVAPARTVVPLVHRGERHDVEFLHPPVRALGDAADRSGAASGSVLGAPGAGSTLRLTLDGEQVTGRVWASADGRTLWVRTNAGLAQLTRPRADTAIGAAAAGAEVLAPMPGSVTGLRAEDGETVVTGQPVVVVEAMKMEHVLTAPADGVVQLSTVQGAQVALDEVLAVIVPEDAEAGADAGAGSTGHATRPAGRRCAGHPGSE